MLFDKITEDYKLAMKARDAAKVATLSFLRAQLKNVLIDNRLDVLEDKDAIAVIKKQVKQREESIQQFIKGGRVDLVEKEKQEVEVLKSYLPAEMTLEAVQALVAAAVKETNAAGMKDMGAVIKVVMAKAAGSADGKMISETVKDVLSRL